MLIISSAELRQLVSMGDAIAAVRAGFVALNAGQVDQPIRLSLADGSFLAMVARVKGEGAVAKLVAISARNRELGLPTLHSVVLWFDALTGEPAALIEGRSLTALRTGAASGVATDLLAANDASIMALVGVGAQAADQIRAVAEVRAIREVRVASRSLTSARRFVEVISSEIESIHFEAVATVAEAAQGADVICTVTTATTPFLNESHVGRRCHINAVGSYRPDMCELSPSLLQRTATIAVDQVSAALNEAGDVIQAIECGAINESQLVEIGTLLGSACTREGITVFKSVGLAVQDWAIAALAVERAQGMQEGGVAREATASIQ